MGTHPIFESDFDCLTDGLSVENSVGLCAMRCGGNWLDVSHLDHNADCVANVSPVRYLCQAV